MKAIKLLLLCFLLTGRVFSQREHTVSISAGKKENFEAEIAKLQERNNSDTIYDFTVWRYKRIGDYYDSLGKTDISFDYYRRAITYGEFDYQLHKRRYFGNIAGRFLKEKQYDSILYYHSVIEKSKPRRVGCGMGKLHLFTDYNYWVMAALDGKGQIDSAIRLFMRYAFQEWTNNEGTEFSTTHLFDNDYHCQMLHFISILEKRYSFFKIYTDVLKMPDIKNFRTVLQADKQSCYYQLNFFIALGNYEHELSGWIEDCKSYEANKKEIYDTYPEFFIQDLRNSFIYRYFTEKVVL